MTETERALLLATAEAVAAMLGDVPLFRALIEAVRREVERAETESMR